VTAAELSARYVRQAGLFVRGGYLNFYHQPEKKTYKLYAGYYRAIAGYRVWSGRFLIRLFPTRAYEGAGGMVKGWWNGEFRLLGSSYSTQETNSLKMGLNLLPYVLPVP
jgi:hypothetical protein